MEKIEFDDVAVDRCTLCKGIWFDALEQDTLKTADGSEEIDSGDPEVGKLFDKEDNVNCPVCNIPMLKMVDPDQTHIHYESCSVCYGAFFDAGEFTDLKFRTFKDFFRDLRSRERS
jgi:Zn-finger nucleic acid-binding protein